MQPGQPVAAQTCSGKQAANPQHAAIPARLHQLHIMITADMVLQLVLSMRHMLWAVGAGQRLQLGLLHTTPLLHL